MDPDDASRAAPWPQPHPSPPLPPPRQYGAPGTPPDHGPGLWLLLAGAVALVAVLVVALVLGTGDEGSGAAGPAAGSTPAVPSSSAPSSAPSSAQSSAPPAAPAPYRCWDGAPAQRLEDCSRPSGAKGLRWVFPAMADDRCAAPSDKGGDGLVLRVLCLHRLADGTRIGVGYFQWASVEAGEAFYADQGLTASEVPGPDGKPVHLGFFGIEGGQVKAATLFASEPFSLTVTYPASVTLSEQDQLALAPRTPDQVRGAPAG